MKKNNLSDVSLEGSIDLQKIIQKAWNGRKFIIKSSIVFFIIGCIYSIISPVQYTSTTTFIPQTSDESSSVNKGLGSLANLAGITLNSETSSSLDNYLSPLLYSKIIASEEFSINLLDGKLINLNGESFTVKQYILDNTSGFNIIGFIKKYTIELFKKENTGIINPEIALAYNFISEQDYSVMNVFREKFFIELNDDEGYINVIALDESAFISTQLVKLITKNLQAEIILLRTKKIKEQLEYSKEQYENKQVEFNILQNKLAEFKDSNKSISTAKFMSELQKLESEFQLQKSILMNLAAEFNRNKIKLNKDTPIFSVIDEVSVPNLRTSPKRIKITIIFSILGFVLSTCFIVYKDSVLDFIKNLELKN